MRVIKFIAISCLITTVLTAQKTAIDRDLQKTYKTGQDFFEHSLYGPSRWMNTQYIRILHPAAEDDFNNFKDDAEAMYVIAGLRADLMSGENELVSFISEKYPNPVNTPAILELGSYYYNRKWYHKCIETYDMVDFDNLSGYELSEAAFKKGYALFVSKEFKSAKQEFGKIITIKNDFYYPANYYYGMCEYFSKNYTGALLSFEKVKNDPNYRSFVPYYLTQIYFATGQYDKVIQQEASLNDTALRYRTEIRQLIGQAYFHRGEYAKSLPHLEYYEANTQKLTIEEFYQLGFTQYQLKKYKEAIKNFNELSLLDNQLGQVSNYYLADCYYRTGDYLSARNAFKKVSQMTYDKSMQEEALFNYGKLSAESGLEREAIQTLLKIDENNQYYAQAQDIISTLLENTSDYATGLQIIESMASVSGKMKVIYQSLALQYGILLYNNGDKDSALIQFAKAGKYQSSRITAAQGAYWSGMIYHDNGYYSKSIEMMSQYFDISNGITWMPDESTQAMAYYTQGYNYLEIKDFKHAEDNFTKAARLFQQNEGKLKNKEITDKVWPDAMVRLGDCYFKARKYKDALSWYNQAAKTLKGDFVYALYQRGIIEGLVDEPYEKIITMRDLKSKYPLSEYADDALLQLGNTYVAVENIDNAYKAYNELIENHKNSPYINEASIKMALIAYNKGDLTRAIQHYKHVFSNNPSAKEAESALLGLQEIYITDLGKSDEYVTYINSLPGYKVTESAADSLAFMVGAMRYNEGEYDKAIAGFSNYLDKYPNGFNKVHAIYYRAESYALVKNYGSALDDYETLAAMGNSEFYIPSLRKSALISYNYTQAFDKALKYYDLYYNNITDVNEKYSAALGALRSAFRTADLASVEKYGKIVLQYPTASTDDKAVAAYYLGKVYLRENKLQEALDAFTQVEKLAENNQAAESRYLIAEILYKQDKKVEAEAQCNKANEANAAYPYWIAKSLLLLSNIYVERNDLFNARAALEVIIEHFPDNEELKKEASEQLIIVEQLEKQNSRIKQGSKDSPMLELQNPEK